MAVDRTKDDDCCCLGMDRSDGLHEAHCPVFKRRAEARTSNQRFSAGWGGDRIYLAENDDTVVTFTVAEATWLRDWLNSALPAHETSAVTDPWTHHGETFQCAEYPDCTVCGPEKAAETTAHPEHRCERCRGPNVVWFAPNEIWNAVHGQWDILCPPCFVQLAEAAGIRPTAWRVAPEETTASPDPYKAVCEGGSGGKCCNPDCEKCWPDPVTCCEQGAASNGVWHDIECARPAVKATAERPDWAIDPFNPHEDGGKCPTCGTYWEVVRPGKWQPHCGCYTSSSASES